MRLVGGLRLADRMAAANDVGAEGFSSVYEGQWAGRYRTGLRAGAPKRAGAFRQVIWPRHRHEFWPRPVQLARLARVVVLLVRSR